eukprot:3903473-Prymnesium_polylepis.1
MSSQARAAPPPAPPPTASTLAVVIGSHRAGEQVWQSLFDNLLAPLAADLAVLAAFDQQPDELLRRSVHVWRVGEYRDWGELITELVGASWRANVSLTTNLWGGVRAGASRQATLQGSGAILLALRHVVLQYLDVLRGHSYHQVVLTRADLYHACPHPPVVASVGEVVAPEGEGGGDGPPQPCALLAGCTHSNPVPRRDRPSEVPRELRLHRPPLHLCLCRPPARARRARVAGARRTWPAARFALRAPADRGRGGGATAELRQLQPREGFGCIRERLRHARSPLPADHVCGGRSSPQRRRAMGTRRHPLAVKGHGVAGAAAGQHHALVQVRDRVCPGRADMRPLRCAPLREAERQRGVDRSRRSRLDCQKRDGPRLSECRDAAHRHVSGGRVGAIQPPGRHGRTGRHGRSHPMQLVRGGFEVCAPHPRIVFPCLRGADSCAVMQPCDLRSTRRLNATKVTFVKTPLGAPWRASDRRLAWSIEMIVDAGKADTLRGG